MPTTVVPVPDTRAAAPASNRGGPDRLIAHAVISGLSFVAYILARLMDGPVGLGLMAVGVSACGWAWLLTRALFDPAPRDAIWPRAVVAVVAVSGAVAVLAPEGGLVARVAANLYGLSGSAALLLTFIEPFQRRGCALTASEKRFRVLFTLGFALLAGMSVLGVWLTPEPIQIGSAIFGLMGAIAATVFRRRHPLPVPPARARAPATDAERRLGERLTRLLQDQAVFADPDLRISDVAARLGEPEHRVSRCITAALGFANFNRLINHHRIQLARHLLAEPEERRSILEIALDCGFASIGPFNRAFKDETGMTPRAWRAEALQSANADPACPAPAASARSA